MARPTASGFTISGLLDKSASTRNDYPVEKIPVDAIANHPANTAYSMDGAGIAQLAKSIKEEGLTDLPLVRKLDDGSWQMVSGHRRKAAYAMLSHEDERYALIPCRIIRDISDEQSVMLLHAANYFVRNLTVTERAAASRALGVEVERMRAQNPTLSGVRAPRTSRRRSYPSRRGARYPGRPSSARSRSHARSRRGSRRNGARPRSQTRSRRTPLASSPTWNPPSRKSSTRPGKRRVWARRRRPSSSGSRPPSPRPKETRRTPCRSPQPRSQAPFARSGATSRMRKPRRASWYRHALHEIAETASRLIQGR